MVHYFSGGKIVIAMRKEYLENFTEYKGKLMPRFEEMQADGKITFIMKEVSDYILGRNGVVLIVTKM